MKILITGHRGYIGANLVYKLRNMEGGDKHVIHGVDIANQDQRPGSRGVDDMLDKSDHLFQSMKDGAEFDTIFHLAAISNVAEFNDNPVQASIDTLSSLKVMEIPHKRFIFASSAAAEHQESMYGRIKRVCEQIIHDKENHHAIALRLHNVVGSVPASNFYELKDPVTHLIPQLVLNNALTIYGDGEQSRDYVDVNSVCEEMIDWGLGHETEFGYYDEDEEFLHKTIEVGYGISYSVIEVLKAYQEVSGKKCVVTFGDERPGDVNNQRANGNTFSQSETYTLEQSIMNTIMSDQQAKLIK